MGKNLQKIARLNFKSQVSFVIITNNDEISIFGQQRHLTLVIEPCE